MVVFGTEVQELINLTLRLPLHDIQTAVEEEEASKSMIVPPPQPV